MTEEKKREPQRAYLLRCWQENIPDEGADWRFSMEQVFPDRSRKSLVGFEALVTFLQTELSGDGSGGRNQ